MSLFSHWIFLSPDPLIIGIRVLRYIAENTLIENIDEHDDERTTDSDKENGNQ